MMDMHICCQRIHFAACSLIFVYCSICAVSVNLLTRTWLFDRLKVWAVLEVRASTIFRAMLRFCLCMFKFCAVLVLGHIIHI